MSSALAEAGLGSPAALAVSKDVREIVFGDSVRRTRALRRVASQAHGDVDFVVVADVEVAFAGRMGGSRVWFEARGSLQLFEVWSGTRLAEVESKVRAADVGDAAAERAARVALGRALAQALRDTASLPWPSRPRT